MIGQGRAYLALVRQATSYPPGSISRAAASVDATSTSYPQAVSARQIWVRISATSSTTRICRRSGLPAIASTVSVRPDRKGPAGPPGATGSAILNTESSMALTGR